MGKPCKQWPLSSFGMIASLLITCFFLYLPTLSGKSSIQLLESQSTSNSNPKPIPFPNLSSMDESVRKQLQYFQNTLQTLVQNPGTPSKQLAQTYGKLGNLYQTYNLLESAEACYRNALQLTPTNFRWPYYLALLYESQGNLEEMASHYRIALSLQPNDLPSLLGLARSQLTQDRIEEAQKLFQQALQIETGTAPALVGMAEIAAFRRQFEKAVENYKKALELQPKASSLQYPLAMSYRQLGKVEKARFHLNEKGDGPVTYPDPLLEELQKARTGHWQKRQIGTSFFDAGNYNQASLIFRQMVSENPKDPVALVDLGTSLTQLGQIEEALEQFSLALLYSDSKSRIHFQMAVTCTLQGWQEKAIKHYRSAVEEDSTYQEAHFQLANVLMQQQLFDEAFIHYRRVIELDPSNEFAHFMGSMSLVRIRKWKEARMRLEEGLAALPDDTDLGHALARLLAACPDPSVRDGQRSIRILQQVLKESKSAEFEHVETLAMVYAELGQFSRAIQIQKMMITEVTRGNRLELAEFLRENLSHYERQEACRTPWRDDDPVFHLAPIPISLLELQ